MELELKVSAPYETKIFRTSSLEKGKSLYLDILDTFKTLQLRDVPLTHKMYIPEHTVVIPHKNQI